MNKNAKQLQRLVNELLELRNMQSGTKIIKSSLNELNAFVKGVMLQFETLAERHAIHFRFISTDEDLVLQFDKEMMEKVLVNLYSNAFKFTPFGGHITTYLSLLGGNETEYAKIQIVDSGKGIERKDLPYIFERFYQGNDALHAIQKGSGLGLSFVKDLVHAHSGSIEVASELNHGTTFTILLPYYPLSDNQKNRVDPYHEATKKIEEEELLPANRPLLLLTEDNPDVLEFLQSSLQNDFSIITAENGKEGFEMAIKKVPDLIVSDVMMPLMDGVELCKRIKSDMRTSHVPVILLTAKSGEESHIEGLDVGADDYIPKPFNVKILRARITNVIASRRKLHELFSSKEPIDLDKVITNDHDRNFLTKLEEVMRSNVKNPNFNHELLVKEIGVSKTQLYRKLQAITGNTVHQYIRNYRLKIAYEAIRTKKDLMISEIVYELGFKDHSYFSKSFHSYFGLWPKDLRNAEIQKP
jgi:DNA-binding response OmpR family regulator